MSLVPLAASVGGSYLVRTRLLRKAGASIWCLLPAVSAATLSNMLPVPVLRAFASIPWISQWLSPQLVAAMLGGSFAALIELSNGPGGLVRTLTLGGPSALVVAQAAGAGAVAVFGAWQLGLYVESYLM